MSGTAKIRFGWRRVRQIADVTELVAALVPGNRNQQYAAARMLLLLRATREPMASFTALEREFAISRRTIERTRAKLAALGLIERVTWMHRRYGGPEGWVLSSRLSTGLRQMAQQIDQWRRTALPEQVAKEEALAQTLR